MFTSLFRTFSNSSARRFNHGCIILFRGKKIVEAWNQEGIFDHAEMRAIKKLHDVLHQPRKIKRCKLYVARFSPNGTCGLSLPCNFCRNAIKAAGIKRVYYSSNSDEIKRLTKDDPSFVTSGHRRKPDPFFDLKYKIIIRNISSKSGASTKYFEWST